jgi:hypothetical protein
LYHQVIPGFVLVGRKALEGALPEAIPRLQDAAVVPLLVPPVVVPLLDPVVVPPVVVPPVVVPPVVVPPVVVPLLDPVVVPPVVVAPLVVAVVPPVVVPPVVLPPVVVPLLVAAALLLPLVAPLLVPFVPGTTMGDIPPVVALPLPLPADEPAEVPPPSSLPRIPASKPHPSDEGAEHARKLAATAATTAIEIRTALGMVEKTMTPGFPTGRQSRMIWTENAVRNGDSHTLSEAGSLHRC